MPKIKRTRRHVIAVTRSGTMHVNRAAYEQDEEVISDVDEDTSFAFDDDRVVPYYLWYAEFRPPALAGFVQAHTGGAKGILEDGRWLLDKAKAIYFEQANGLGYRNMLGWLSNRRTGMYILGAGTIIAVLLLGLTFWSIETQQDLAEARDEREAAQETKRQADAAEKAAIDSAGPGARPGDGFTEPAGGGGGDAPGAEAGPEAETEAGPEAETAAGP